MNLHDELRAEEEVWRETMVARGHQPKLDDDGTLDVFFLDSGFHNGPGCTVCYWSACMHCDTPESIPQCTQAHIDADYVVVGDGRSLEDKT